MASLLPLTLLLFTILCKEPAVSANQLRYYTRGLKKIKCGDGRSKCTSTASTATSSRSVPSISFHAAGDVPYSDMESCLLPLELAKIPKDSSSFFVHLGDIRDGKPNPYTGELYTCPESVYTKTSTIVEASPVTTFIILGDNEWLDCANPQEAYDYWNDHLVHMNERTDLGWPTFPANVMRHEHRAELFSFVLDGGTLFLGQSLPGNGRNNNNEWNPRTDLLNDNIEWTEQHLSANAGNLNAVIIFGHSIDKPNLPYLNALHDMATNAAYGKPPILFMTDGHSYDVEEEWMEVPNLLRVQLDDSVTPVKITINPGAAFNGCRLLGNVFKINRRCPCTSSHRPTMIVESPREVCSGSCDEVVRICKDEDPCSPWQGGWDGNSCSIEN